MPVVLMIFALSALVVAVAGLTGGTAAAADACLWVAIGILALLVLSWVERLLTRRTEQGQDDQDRYGDDGRP